MALTNLGGHILYPDHLVNDWWTGVTETLSAEGHKVAYIFRMPKSGTLKKVGFRTYTITTGGTLSVTLETVDDTTGYPTGSLKYTNGSGSVAIADGDDSVPKYCEINSTSGISVTKGDLVAMVLAAPSGFTGGINYGYGAAFGNFPYVGKYTTGAWVLDDTIPACCLIYDDEFMVPYGCWLPMVQTTASFSSSSNPNHRGNRFKFPFKSRCVGAIVDLDADEAVDIILYGSNGTSVLASASIDKDIRGANNQRNMAVTWTSAIELEKDTYYRIVVKPTTTTNISWRICDNTDDSSLNAMACRPGGADIHYTTCNNTPAQEADWSQTTTRRACISLILDQIDPGSGGGLMNHPGMDGGCNA